MSRPLDVPNPDSDAWRDRMESALTTGNLGAMADLLLAGIAKPKAPEPMDRACDELMERNA